MSGVLNNLSMDLLSVSGNWRWPEDRLPLLVTNHGGHLYGTASGSQGRVMVAVLDGPGDFIDVRKENGVEVIMTDLGYWINRCSAGDPGALETMFAPDPLIDMVPDLRAKYTDRPDWGIYLHEILLATEHGDESVRIHALRLAWNMHQMRATGRFDPVLHPLQVNQYRTVVERYEGEQLHDIAMRVAWK